MSLSQQQIAALAAMGMPYNPANAAPVAAQAGTPFQLPQNQSQPAVPFSVVANPNQFAQPFPQQQATAPQPQNNPVASPQTVFAQRIPAGPGVPQAFVGRTVQEIMDGLIRTAGQRQAQVPAANPQLQAQAQQQILQNSQQAPAQVQTPAGMTMEGIQQAIHDAMTQQQLPQLVMQMEQAVASQSTAYSNPTVRARVQEIIGQLPMEQQAQRGMWDYAVTLAVGEMVQKNGEMPGFMPTTRPQDRAWTGNQPQQPQPAMTMPQGAYVAPTPGFAEGPTNNTFNVGGRPPLTMQEGQISQKLGLDPMKVAEYNSAVFGGA